MRKTVAILLTVILLISVTPIIALAENVAGTMSTVTFDETVLTSNITTISASVGDMSEALDEAGAGGSARAAASIVESKADDGKDALLSVTGAGGALVVRYIAAASAGDLTAATTIAEGRAIGDAYVAQELKTGDLILIIDGLADEATTVEIKYLVIAVTVTSDPSSPGGIADDRTDTSDGSGALIPDISYTQKRVATLPTAKSFNFVLDPYGLYYLSDAEIKALVLDEDTGILGWLDPEDSNKWKLLPNAGQIIFSDYAPVFVNESNFDVALEIGFTLKNNGAEIVPKDDPTAVTKVSTTTTADIFIGATFSKENVKTLSPTTFAGEVTLPLLMSKRAPVFLLEAAKYTDVTDVTRDSNELIESIVIKRFDTKVADTGNGTQYMFSGKVNPYADWNTVLDGKELSIEIEYKLQGPTVDAWAFSDEAGYDALGVGAGIPDAHGLVAGNTLTAASFKSVELTSGGPVGPQTVNLPRLSVAVGSAADAANQVSIKRDDVPGEIKIKLVLTEAASGMVPIVERNGVTMLTSAYDYDDTTKTLTLKAFSAAVTASGGTDRIRLRNTSGSNHWAIDLIVT